MTPYIPFIVYFFGFEKICFEVWSERWNFEPKSLIVTWIPLSWLVVIMHAIEIWVKYQALGSAKVLIGALGNIILCGLILCAIFIS